MATMFPRPLPEDARGDPRRAAERTMYESFERQLPTPVRVFYRFAWLAKRRNEAARDGETDFLVADPERGLMVVEVKGGRVARDGQLGRWTSTDRFGVVHDIKDPAEQTRAAQYALLNKLDSIPAWRGADVRVVRAVAFPDCADPGNSLVSDLPREMTVYASDVRYLPEKIDAIFRYWEGQVSGKHTIDSGLLAMLERVLAPTFQLRLPLGPSISDDDRQILELTAKQFDVLGLVARNRRVAVSGGAGTGKTVLAVEKAKRLAAEGYRTLLTCFNVPLAAYLRESVGTTERLTVTNFHDLCYRTASAAGVVLPDPGGPPQPSEFYEEQLPQALVDALAAHPEARFDAIVVDEGQDFLESYWVALQLALADPDDGILYVFHDDNQCIYRGGIPRGLVPVHLDRNLRNTRPIHALAQKFYQGDAMQAAGPAGRPVEFLEAEDSQALKRRLSQVVHRLVHDEAVAASDIAVLTGRAAAKSAVGKDGMIGAYRCTRDQRADPGAVLLDTVHRFKGLERPVVILVELDDYVARGKPELLYVGVSRARAHLVMIGSKATLAKLREL